MGVAGKWTLDHLQFVCICVGVVYDNVTLYLKRYPHDTDVTSDAFRNGAMETVCNRTEMQLK